MEDNTNEEHLDNPTTNQSENPPDEITTTVTETINPNQESENMETHAQDLHKAPGHGWKHYLFEFFMLFLAVFCGFLAENVRETQVEKDREKEYIKTMISDLRDDTISLNNSIKGYKQKGIELDSLIYLLNASEIKERGAEIYFYGRKANRFSFFTSTDRTIQQMKNSGAFRLIRNDSAASGILAYYSIINKLYIFQNNANLEAEDVYKIDSKKLFNPLVFETMVNDATHNEVIKPTGNFQLLTFDKSTILNVISTIHYLQGSRRNLQYYYVDLKESAVKLIQLLKKEYHLENE